jgi:hypothetical protein
MGINYHLLPIPIINQHTNLKFQQYLLTQGIDVTRGMIQRNRITIRRDPPQLLEINLIAQSIQPPIGQILIVAPHPERPLRQFVKEVEAVLKAFDEAWPAVNRQIVSCDVALRCLYSSTCEHAFQEIWEERLGQPTDLINKLGRRVRGGGLRFVMPPQQSEPRPAQVELKIESFLQDTKKIFIEVQFLWPRSEIPGEDFASADRLNEANEYIKNQVHAFMMEDES